MPRCVICCGTNVLVSHFPVSVVWIVIARGSVLLTIVPTLPHTPTHDLHLPHVPSSKLPLISTIPLRLAFTATITIWISVLSSILCAMISRMIYYWLVRGFALAILICISILPSSLSHSAGGGSGSDGDGGSTGSIRRSCRNNSSVIKRLF